MELSNKTTGQKIEKPEDKYVFDFGEIKFNTSASEVLVMEGDNLKVINITADCGCTTGVANIVDKNKIEVEVRYKNTHIKSPFSKNVQIDFFENGERKYEIINIKGIVA